MQNKSFALDTENLVRAARTPLIIAGVLGLTWLFRIYLGYLYSPAITFLESFAGALYMKSILDSGKKPHLINAGLNGAVLGGITILVYGIISWLTINIASQEKDWSFDLLALIFNMLEGAFVGFLGALAWFTYKTNTDN